MLVKYPKIAFYSTFLAFQDGRNSIMEEPPHGTTKNSTKGKIMQRYALISVSDKAGITKFAKALVDFGLTLISTGGTAKALEAAGIPYTPIERFTGFPEMFDGRLKTLHPKVHGGILQIRGNQTHEASASEHGVAPIDFVVVNFYPFKKTLQKPNVTHPEVIENIDIGGPGMARSAAKNYASVTVIVNPADYDGVLECMRKNGGETTLELREGLAGNVFRATADYDKAIADYFDSLSNAQPSVGKILPKREAARVSIPPPSNLH